MSTIKASCPVDGEVELTSADITLAICEQRPALSTYRFHCPVCADPVVKQAPDNIVSLLRSAKVPEAPIRIPAEALEQHTGERISYDDILDFHLELERTDGCLVAVVERESR